MLLKKILVIQTAFIGDVVLASPVWEKLRISFPNSLIDVLARKGNESLLNGHPFINQVLVWDKQKGKYKELIRTIITVRKKKYDAVINLQRFASSGLITVLSGADYKAGFDKNPLSFLFNHKAPHLIGKKGDKNWIHETDRNLSVLTGLCDTATIRMQLYPSQEDLDWAKSFSQKSFITISPASVWFTKQTPALVWNQFISTLGTLQVVLLGGMGDRVLCEKIKALYPDKVRVMAGELSLLRSAALMKFAAMNYVNDSAPMHLASAVDAPVTAVFCSTIPEFGFGPRSSSSHVVEYTEPLSCKPCALHGRSSCPEGHFNCSKILAEQLKETLK
ncbi:MAG: glycosyltransferase family 9 protein [Flavobacteriales bacterium]|nr:glycosyltransferase family 9 protein [Flavobacteriales bacterium]